jgi:hypothetical protein
MKYETVFDLLQVGYRQWTSPAFGLIFVISGAWLAHRRSTRPAPPGWWSAIHPYLYLAFACVWTLVAFFATYGQYRHMRNALETGRYVTIEGTVRNFVPMPVTGHSMETFEIDGRRYSYSDYVVTAGFNNTQSHGGPIREGLHVRIADVGGHIARLEIAR